MTPSIVFFKPLLLILITVAVILEAAPVTQDDEFLKVVEQIRKVSASIGPTKVDVYDHLVKTIPKPDRLKMSRRVLRKLLHLRDKKLSTFSLGNGRERLT